MTNRSGAQPDLAALRGEIAARQISKRAIAAYLGVSESLFSLFTHGRRQAPDGFEERVLAAIDLLEKAEQAAEKERQRVLEGAVE